MSLYPSVETYASPALVRRKKVTHPDYVLDGKTQYSWSAEIDYLKIQGLGYIDEFVFFHKQSKSLIVSDLVFNLPAEHFK